MKKTFTYKPYGTSITSDVLFCSTISDMVLLPYMKKFHSALFVYDCHLVKSQAQNVIAIFRKSIGKITPLSLPYGPKSLKNLKRIWEFMIMSSPDLVVGMGGGVTTDLVGFASSTYQRGTPHVLVPTTVLSMIDASLGGKTGIDYGGVKNSIGAVHYPIAVINIMNMLQTLPKQEFFSGFAEAVKAAVLFDRKFFQELEQYANIGDFSSINPKLFAIMYHSASLKMKNSEMPKLYKIKLLYGHGVGHGIELLGRQIRHGDAVAIGMTIEGALACLLGIWNTKEWQDQTKLLRKLHLPTARQGLEYSIDRLMEKMSHYKKLIAPGKFGFILPEKIGKVSYGDGMFLTFVARSRMKVLLQRAILLARSWDK